MKKTIAAILLIAGLLAVAAWGQLLKPEEAVSDWKRLSGDIIQGTLTVKTGSRPGHPSETLMTCNGSGSKSEPAHDCRLAVGHSLDEVVAVYQSLLDARIEDARLGHENYINEARAHLADLKRWQRANERMRKRLLEWSRRQRSSMTPQNAPWPDAVGVQPSIVCSKEVLNTSTITAAICAGCFAYWNPAKKVCQNEPWVQP